MKKYPRRTGFDSTTPQNAHRSHDMSVTVTVTYLEGRDTGERLFTSDPFIDYKNYSNTFLKSAFFPPPFFF